jgi:alkylated DNA repair dioxygenase AlkB
VHALVSEYRPGTPIGWHRDKPVYGIVIGVSLAGWGRMRFRPLDSRAARATVLLELEPRSVYVMQGPIRWLAAQHAADQGALLDHFPHRAELS